MNKNSLTPDQFEKLLKQADSVNVWGNLAKVRFFKDNPDEFIDDDENNFLSVFDGYDDNLYFYRDTCKPQLKDTTSGVISATDDRGDVIDFQLFKYLKIDVSAQA